ncbi:MAG: hypothetical protein HYW34_01700 [Candidatus Brennerbacteria bacterium]|nr:hypothetical protein [Candidatus Brennerbacteria bacterium]
MEQYWMPKELDFENLRLCLDNYPVDSLYIRLVGSAGGTVKVNENLEGRILDFKKDESGLYLFIDLNEVFRFSLIKDYQKGFSLAYERIFDDGTMYIPRGISDNPYDENLPEPRRSFLRHVLDDHLLEIFFKGRVNLQFHSWWIRPYWKYWMIAKPGSIEEIILKQQIEYIEDGW